MPETGLLAAPVPRSGGEGSPAPAGELRSPPPWGYHSAMEKQVWLLPQFSSNSFVDVAIRRSTPAFYLINSVVFYVARQPVGYAVG